MVRMPPATLLAQPLATAEFIALDTETNGLARERCELTEVGAVLVGGGELHDRWSSLVGVGEPLGRGIQRFTGITQQMVDEAPPPEAVLPQLAKLLQGRVLVAHNAAFDTRVLKQAFARAALDWPDPPVLCTVALARRFAPLQRRRGLASLADALGIDVGRDAPRAARRGDLRARAVRAAAAPARGRLHDRRGARRACGPSTAPAAGGARPGPSARATSARTSRSSRTTRASTSSATPTGTRSTSASRSACARAPARTSRRRSRGRARPSTSTTSRRSPSSARCCSRTG